MTMTEERSQIAPRIYAASLSDYNAGRLHGAWIDCEGLDADDIGAAVREMLADSPEAGAEEWAIHDSEGFGGIEIGEYDSFETVAALASAISEHGGAYAAYYENVGGAEYASPEGFEEAYAGEWDSLEDYARELFDDCAPSQEARELIDSWPFTCIDWARAAHELEIGGDVWTAESGAPNYGVWVFRNV